MFKTFKAFFKNIYKSKWRLISYVVLLFIPFIYGFTYMNAYWDPFKNSQNLKIGIVNLHDGDQNADLAKETIIKDGKNYKLAGSDFKVNFIDLTRDINSKSSDFKEQQQMVQDLVKNNNYSAIVMIPDLYQDSGVPAPNPKSPNYAAEWKEYSDHHIMHFYNSYKNNFLAGEMTNFISGLKKLQLASAYPTINHLVNNSSKQNLVPDFHQLAKKFVNIHTTGKNINSYGFGLSPYFISIALWAGCLTMTFLIKNVRHTKGVSTLKHYFGNTLVWLLTGWAQATILLTAITLQGVNLGWSRQWELWLFVYFTSVVFALFTQGVVFSIRYGDLGDFFMVILLVIQLIASSGTFPVEMQNTIFKIIHPVAPFTYAIENIREIYEDPNTWIIIKNMGILLIFPTVSISIALIRNYIFDKKIFKRKAIYESFEIHLGDT